MKSLRKYLPLVCACIIFVCCISKNSVFAMSEEEYLKEQEALIEELNAEGNKETDVLGVTNYNLWVGNVRVTDENKDDIPGLIGKASFDPKTETLTLENVTGITDCEDRTSKDGLNTTYFIYAGQMNLKIVGNATLKNVFKGGIGSLMGSVTVNADLTIESEWSAINAFWVNIMGGKYDLKSKSCGILSRGAMNINDGNIVVRSDDRGISYGTEWEGQLRISGGNLDVSGVNGAIKGKGNAYVDMRRIISQPIGGYYGVGGIYDANGVIAKSVIIKEREQLTGNVIIDIQDQIERILIAKVKGCNAKNIAYQWLRDGYIIQGASGYMYHVTEEDVNKDITCMISDYDGIYLESICGKPRVIVSIDEAGYVQLSKNTDVGIVFDDVNDKEWYYSATQFAYDNGIMNGTSEITFEPLKLITRAQFVTVLHNTEGKPEADLKEEFVDVKIDQWYAKPVIWAFENNITSGIGEGKFGPDVEISREQLATMLYKYAQTRDDYELTISDSILNEFPDKGEISSWASEGISWAVTNGVMSGKAGKDGKNVLDPLGNATRVECAQMIKNMKERAIKSSAE